MADHFEGKLHAFRRTQDGVVISYVVHPNDVSAAMATAALGTRYMIAFEEITDNPEPTGNPARSGPYKAGTADGDAGVTDRKDGHQPKDRKPFASLPLSQQAAMRTQDKDFQLFLEQRGPIHDQESYADAVCAICNVESRANIKLGTPAGIAWMALEAEYQNHITTQRYAEVRK